MKRNLRLFASAFVITFAVIFLSFSISRSSAVGLDSECGECMRNAAQRFNACLKSNDHSEKCYISFERQRYVCRLNYCGSSSPTENPTEPGDVEAPPEP